MTHFCLLGQLVQSQTADGLVDVQLFSVTLFSASSMIIKSVRQSRIGSKEIQLFCWHYCYICCCSLSVCAAQRNFLPSSQCQEFAKVVLQLPIGSCLVSSVQAPFVSSPWLCQNLYSRRVQEPCCESQAMSHGLDTQLKVDCPEITWFLHVTLVMCFWQGRFKILLPSICARV